MLSDYLLHALKYLRLVCAARQLVIPLVLFFCVSGWLMAWYLPNVYQSETRVYVDTKTKLDEMLEGIVDKGDNAEQDLVDLARVRLVTTTNLEKVAIQNDMLLDVRTDLDKKIVLEDLKNDVNIISQRRQGTRQGTQDLIISYRDIDADRSRAVVSSFLDVFLTGILDETQKDHERAEQFLDMQIEQYNGLLNESESLLKNFKIKNSRYMPGENGGFFEELRKMEDKYNEATLDLRQAVQRRDRLQIEFARLNGGPGTGSIAAVRRGQRIQELEALLNELRLQYTDLHPEVIGTSEQLATLKDGFVAPAVSNNSAGAQFQLANFAGELSKAEADVGGAEARVDEYRNRKAELNASVQVIPEIEEEFGKLTRNYDVYRERYEEFLKRRDRARIDAANDRENAAFAYQVVEAPRTLPRPVEPNRPLLITLIFMGAWALGVAIPIFLDLVRPSVSSLNDIAKLTEFPVLGTVSMTENSAATMRMGMKTLLVFLILTTIAYAALAVLSLLPQTFTLSDFGG